MRSATESAFEEKYRTACYYAVREDFNAQTDPKFLEENPKLDTLIRWGIETIERRNRLPRISRIEMEALARCAIRRGIHPSQRKVNERK